MKTIIIKGIILILTSPIWFLAGFFIMSISLCLAVVSFPVSALEWVLTGRWDNPITGMIYGAEGELHNAI